MNIMEEKNFNQPILFQMDSNSFKKRLLFRTFVVLILNFSMLSWAFFRIPSDSQSKILLFFVGILLFILFVLYKGYQKQMKVLQEAIVELKDDMVLQHGYANSCNEIQIRQIRQIRRDSYRGYARVQVISDNFAYSFINLKEVDAFQNELEKRTGLKTQLIKKDYKKLATKAFMIFLPSLALIPFVFIPAIQLPIKMVFIVANINFIFFIFTFSERKMPDGLSDQLSRRLLILAIAILAFQFYLMYV